jgi:dolichol-phosphate mannosyltransferase
MGQRIVLLPTYNEALNLAGLVEAILRASDAAVLVIDDNSPDGTGALADALHATHPTRVWVRHRPAKEGLGRAYADGYAWALAAGYEVVLQMDADFSHDPAALPRLAAAVDAGADVAIGSRYVRGGQTPGWPWRRRLLSWAGSRYAAAVLGLPVRDVTGGFKAFSRRALQLLARQELRAAGFAVQIETTYLAHEHGLVLREVPIVFRDRRAGTSKMSGQIVLEAVQLPWRLRTARVARRRLPPHSAADGAGGRQLRYAEAVVPWPRGWGTRGARPVAAGHARPQGAERPLDRHTAPSGHVPAQDDRA